ncbi:MAG: DUF1385 domain-containing protein [Anaerolineaceae bacterium]
MTNSPDTALRMPAYGGQAVMEGVMMRGKKNVAMAVRAPNGEIVTFEEQLPSFYQSKWAKMPFVRGLISLWDSLGLGMRYLTKSANVQTGEDEKLEGTTLFLTILVAIVIGVGMFFLLPALVAGWLDGLFKLGPWWSNLLEGLLRLIILVIYLAAVGKMPEIKRTFMYHGAEHKTINAFEAGVELTPENVAKQTKVHPRCGTSFILTLVLISVLFFSLLGPLPLGWRLVSRILMLPIVAGIAYEYIRWAARAMETSAVVRFLIKPNLLLQKLSTREPSLDMLEVSIKAFQTMYAMEIRDSQAAPGAV